MSIELDYADRRPRTAQEVISLLNDAGFTGVSVTTKGGVLIDETLFNTEGIRIEIDYRFMKERL